MLILSRKCGESLIIGQGIEVIITEVSGDKVKIGIDAPESVKILRKELVLTAEANKQAAGSVAGNALSQLAASLHKLPPATKAQPTPPASNT